MQDSGVNEQVFAVYEYDVKNKNSKALLVELKSLFSLINIKLSQRLNRDVDITPYIFGEFFADCVNEWTHNRINIVSAISGLPVSFQSIYKCLRDDIPAVKVTSHDKKKRLVTMDLNFTEADKKYTVSIHLSFFSAKLLDLNLFSENLLTNACSLFIPFLESKEDIIEIIDFCNGIKSLKSLTISVNGDVSCFNSQPDKILQFIHCAAKYDCKPDVKATKAIKKYKNNLLSLDSNIVMQQLETLFSQEYAAKALAILNETGMLEILSPQQRGVINNFSYNQNPTSQENKLESDNKNLKDPQPKTTANGGTNKKINYTPDNFFGFNSLFISPLKEDNTTRSVEGWQRVIINNTNHDKSQDKSQVKKQIPVHSSKKPKARTQRNKVINIDVANAQARAIINEVLIEKCGYSGWLSSFFRKERSLKRELTSVHDSISINLSSSNPKSYKECKNIVSTRVKTYNLYCGLFLPSSKTHVDCNSILSQLVIKNQHNNEKSAYRKSK